MQAAKFLSAAIIATQASSRAMVGTNIGGWMVLEPWITPSFFYRFLGKTASEGVGSDCWTVCEALGAIEGNKIMRAHWDAWLTEDHIRALSEREVEIVRLPIGDWTLKPYGPYIGCMDGAAEKIQWSLDMFKKYNIKVLLDVHALKGSQNGFDNSGISADTEWIDETHFSHWPTQNAHWMGTWNGTEYDINQDNIDWALDNVRVLMEKYGHHPAVYAFEPVNEPWWNSDLVTLKNFYRQARNIVREVNPDVVFVFHESFRKSASVWNDLFPDNDMKNVVLDTHPYMAFWIGENTRYTTQDYCDEYTAWMTDPDTASIKYPMWAGEWALGTDTCAMWLNGFNDNRDPKVHECAIVDCPTSYMPSPYNVDFDRTLPEIGPFGMSASSIQLDGQVPRYGMCETDSNFFNEADVQELADCHLDLFDRTVEAQFMWTFRAEIEPRWDYIRSYDMGWLNRKNKVFLK